MGLARHWPRLLALLHEVATEPRLAGRRDRAGARGAAGPDPRPRGSAWPGRQPCPAPRAFRPAGLRASDERGRGDRRRITRANLVDAVRGAYAADRLVLAVSGAVRPMDVLAEVGRLFDGLRLAPSDVRRRRAPGPSRASPRARDVADAAGPRAARLPRAARRRGRTTWRSRSPTASWAAGCRAGSSGPSGTRRGSRTPWDPSYPTRRAPGRVVLHIGTAPENAAAAEAGLRREVDRLSGEPVPRGGARAHEGVPVRIVRAGPSHERAAELLPGVLRGRWGSEPSTCFAIPAFSRRSTRTRAACRAPPLIEPASGGRRPGLRAGGRRAAAQGQRPGSVLPGGLGRPDRRQRPRLPVRVLPVVRPGDRRHAVLGRRLYEQLVAEFGLIPCRFGDICPPGLDTALAGAPAPSLTIVYVDVRPRGTAPRRRNMLYLWIFGKSVEDAMGHGRFLVFYLVCGVAAGAAHYIQDPASAMPMVGASGAVVGDPGRVPPAAPARPDLDPLGLRLLRADGSGAGHGRAGVLGDPAVRQRPLHVRAGRRRAEWRSWPTWGASLAGLAPARLFRRRRSAGGADGRDAGCGGGRSPCPA